MQMHFETKATAQNIFSKITGLVCFVNCISNYLCSLSISPTQKHIRDICLDCISSEYHSFYQLMRVSFKEQPILESPWLHFISIDDKIFWRGRITSHRHKTPFHAGVETCAATTFQVAVLNLFLHFLRCHSFQHFQYCSVTTQGFILLQVRW